MALRGHPGGPWGQQDGFEMVVYRILLDFGVILGPVYIRYLNSRILKFVFFLGFVSRSFFSIYETEFQHLGLPNRGFRMDGIANTDFPRK